MAWSDLRAEIEDEFAEHSWRAEAIGLQLERRAARTRVLSAERGRRHRARKRRDPAWVARQGEYRRRAYAKARIDPAWRKRKSEITLRSRAKLRLDPAWAERERAYNRARMRQRYAKRRLDPAWVEAERGRRRKSALGRAA